MDGFLNINKPKGMVSFEVIKHLQERLKTKKMGHAGNLDPNAEGVLLVGIGKATRFLPFIMELEKEYMAVVKLGISTDTLDITGEILDKREIPPFNKVVLENILKEFTGEIEQIPPSFSAAKIKGERLYDLARKGVLVSKKPKKVNIYSIELVELGEDEFTMEVRCSKGTYIRSLARDIGEKMGTFACIKELVRTRIGHFRIEDALGLQDITEEDIIEIDKGINHLKMVRITGKAVKYFRNGNPVAMRAILQMEGTRNFEQVRVYSEESNFLGVGLLKYGELLPKIVLPEPYGSHRV